MFHTTPSPPSCFAAVMIFMSIPIWVVLWMRKKHVHDRRRAEASSAEKDGDAVAGEDTGKESEQVEVQGKETELEEQPSFVGTDSVYREKGAGGGGGAYDDEGHRRLNVPSVIDEAPGEGDMLGGDGEATNSPRPSRDGDGASTSSSSSSCSQEKKAAEVRLDPLMPYLELRMIITTLSVIFYFYLTVTTALVSVFLCRRLDVIDPPPIYYEYSIARGW